MRKRPIEILTPWEVERLLGAPNPRTPTGARNKALLGVFYFGGLRLAEALSLEWSDLDFRQRTIQVRRGKGAKHRRVALAPRGWDLLDLWRNHRIRRGWKWKKVFTTLAGAPLQRAYVQAMVHRYARKAGIRKRVFPHLLRHTHASHLAERGVPVNVIQAQLGHTSLATTSKYLGHVAPVALVQYVEQALRRSDETEKP